MVQSLLFPELVLLMALIFLGIALHLFGRVNQRKLSGLLWLPIPGILISAIMIVVPDTFRWVQFLFYTACFWQIGCSFIYLLEKVDRKKKVAGIVSVILTAGAAFLITRLPSDPVFQMTTSGRIYRASGSPQILWFSVFISALILVWAGRKGKHHLIYFLALLFCVGVETLGLLGVLRIYILLFPINLFLLLTAIIVSLKEFSGFFGQRPPVEIPQERVETPEVIINRGEQLNGIRNKIGAAKAVITEKKILIQKMMDTAGQLDADALRLITTADELEKERQNLEKTRLENEKEHGELSRGVREISLSSEKTSEGIQNLIYRVGDGKKLIEDSLNEMSRIRESLQEVNQIIGMIGEISDDTNMLAMNAAIEAYHAGEKGRGFSIVADEIRDQSVLMNKQSRQIDGFLKIILEKSASQEEIANEIRVIFQDFSGNIEKLFIFILNAIEISRHLKSTMENQTVSKSVKDRQELSLTGVRSLALELKAILEMDVFSGILGSFEGVEAELDVLSAELDRLEE